MNTQKLSIVTAIIAIASSAVPALAQTNTDASSEVTFTCEVNGSVPTTILKTGESDRTIFNWQSEYLPENRTPFELCNEVASKLNDYSADESNDLSALTFNTYELGGRLKLAMVCATDEPRACNTKLFTLPLPESTVEQPITIANRLLEDILDKDLQTTKVVNTKRGLQSVSHSIDIWELILGRKLIKRL